MAFVNEKLTEIDKEFIASFKFYEPLGSGRELAEIPDEWSIDKESRYYLICLGGRGNLNEEYPPYYYKLIMSTSVVEVEARYKRKGDGKTGVSISWIIESITVPKELGDLDTADIHQIVKSAFKSYGDVHFSNHIVSTEFVALATPFYIGGEKNG